MSDFLNERVAVLAKWMVLREQARIGKESGAPKPWVDDPVLQSTRFCCVRRMDDKVSKWLLDNWYSASKTPARYQVLANVGLARLINKIESLEKLKQHGLNKKWDAQVAGKVMAEIIASGKSLFTGAYIINGIAGQSKTLTVLNQVQAMHDAAGALLDTTSMQKTHKLLQGVKGNGSFMAGQMVADLRHVMPGAWSDKSSWAPIGPGSRRGIAWMLGWDGIEELTNMTQDVFIDHIRALGLALRNHPAAWAVVVERKLEMHDLQNCLCETDKYLRITMGTGRGKNKYPGGAQAQA